MGIRFSKSIKIGKFLRLNLSKSGIGFSVGTKGYRIGISPKKIVRQTITLPKTGISYVKEFSLKKLKRK